MNIDDFDFGFDDGFDFDEIPQFHEEDEYPDFFLKWDKAVKSGQHPGLFSEEELREIIEYYIIIYNMKRAWEAIDYALNIHKNDEYMVYFILDTFKDFKLWSDQLKLTSRYKNSPDYEIHKSKIDALLHLGMEEEAFLAFRQVKQLFAQDKDALYTLYYTMGEALYDIGLHESSIHVIQEAIDLLGEDVEWYWLQIDSYIAIDDNEKVIALTEKIASAFPFDSEVWHRIGFCYYDADEYERAIQAFEFADNLDILNHRQNLVGLIKAYEKNGNTDIALEKVKEFLYLYPDKYNINLLAASLAAELKDWEGAIKFLNKLIEKEPENQAYYLYRSAYYINMGEYKKAKLTLEQGIANARGTSVQLSEQLNNLNKQYPDI